VCDSEIINVKDKIVHSPELLPYPALTLEFISQKESLLLYSPSASNTGTKYYMFAQPSSAPLKDLVHLCDSDEEDGNEKRQRRSKAAGCRHRSVSAFTDVDDVGLSGNEVTINYFSPNRQVPGFLNSGSFSSLLYHESHKEQIILFLSELDDIFYTNEGKSSHPSPESKCIIGLGVPD
jgi:hypothetical protein